MTLTGTDHDLERNSSNEKVDVKHEDHIDPRSINEAPADLKWTFTRVIAVAALCIAYVGSSLTSLPLLLSIPQNPSNTQ